MIRIYKDMPGNIEPNFQYREFYSKSPFPPEEHPFDDTLARVLQQVRDYYTNKHWKVTVLVTSSYRTKLSNYMAGGVVNSLHLVGKAVDWKFGGQDASRAMEHYRDQIRNERYLFNKMRSMGITSFGIYDTFNHIDTGSPEEKRNNSREDKYGLFSKWDKTKGDESDEQLHDLRNHAPVAVPVLAALGLLLIWR